MILSEVPLKNMSDAANEVGISKDRLTDLLLERGLSDAVLWEVVPAEHEATLIEIKREQEAFESVRQNEPETPQEQPVELTSSPAMEIPMMPEQVAQKGGKMTKGKTSKLTDKRKKSIGKQLANIETIDLGIDNAEALNLVRDAAADGVELGQAQVLAKESARLSVRRKAYERTTAKLKEKAVKRAEYDPTDLLKQAGLQVSDDLLEDLQEFSEVSLGKFQTVFEEVTGDVWGNGYTNDFSDLDTQLDWSE